MGAYFIASLSNPSYFSFFFVLMPLSQLSVEILDFAELAFAKGNASFSLNTFAVFQPAWILAMAIIWLSLKQTVANFTPNSGRVVGLIHAFSMVIIGIPVLLLLGKESFDYALMHESLIFNHSSIAITCNIMAYTSIGYFLMDSFLVKKQYLQHHIGAMTAWLFAAYHHDTSLVHGAVVIALFETGAILVQCSRMFPKLLWFRTFVCCGYTATRLGLTWYYGFIFFTCYQFWSTMTLLVQLVYVPIFSALLFLLAINAKWTTLQWKALVKAFKQEGMDFYTYHQKIIGNA